VKDKNKEEQKDQLLEKERKVDSYYRRLTRIIEYYVITCFFIIVVVPLFHYDWINPFMKFIYFTGFPLLILLILVGLFKDALLDYIDRFIN